MPAKFLKSVVRAADIPEDNKEAEKPQIAMLGRSNVGKSSLINHLAGTNDLARTSARPGLTQTINVYEFENRYLLIDLPGYGYSRADRSEGKGFAGMIGDYLSDSAMLKLALLIVDGRHDLTESDSHVLQQLLEQEIPFAIILNKTDKLSNSAAAQALRKVQAQHPAIEVIPHSTAANKTLAKIREVIERAIRK